MLRYAMSAWICLDSAGTGGRRRARRPEPGSPVSCATLRLAAGRRRAASLAPHTEWDPPGGSNASPGVVSRLPSSVTIRSRADAADPISIDKVSATT